MIQIIKNNNISYMKNGSNRIDLYTIKFFGITIFRFTGISNDGHVNKNTFKD